MGSVPFFHDWGLSPFSTLTGQVAPAVIARGGDPAALGNGGGAGQGIRGRVDAVGRVADSYPVQSPGVLR